MASDAFGLAQADFQKQIHGGPSRTFEWPVIDTFNWALDWFDAELSRGPYSDLPALRILGDDGTEEISFAEMSIRSSRIANGLRRQGVRRGDRILLMLGNVVPLWETMLAAMKLGAVVIPSTTMLTVDDVAERIVRARVQHVVTSSEEAWKLRKAAQDVQLIYVGNKAPDGRWVSFETLREAADVFIPDGDTAADDPMLLYFTSGTTSRPKMVLHSHRSYPVGSLTTMLWIGAGPGDVHMAIGAPGWAGHTYMAFFGPWNAGATITMLNQKRFDPTTLLTTLVDQQVTSFFAPPTVWRMLLQQNLTKWQVVLRDASSAGEPLNAEVIEQVRRAWGITIRDGWGQTEVTVQIANTPGQPVRPGRLGFALPGCSLAVLDEHGNDSEEGELALPLHPRPPGLMLGYLSDANELVPLTGTHYRTGDSVRRDPDGSFTYIGRVDDVFKSSDYRISPFELESALIEHPAVMEAAVVPSPDSIRLVVPKAYIALAADYPATRDTALEIFRHIGVRLAPFKRVRRIEFTELPKNIAGKIRRVALRQKELDWAGKQPEGEFREQDFPELTKL